MLHYLIKTIDNTFYAGIAIAILLSVFHKHTATEKKQFIAWGILFGIVSAIIYMVLKRTTGYAVREYYDLAVLLPSIFLSPFYIIFAIRSIKRGETYYSLIFVLLTSALLGLWVAYFLPNLLLYPFEFHVGMKTIFSVEVFYKLTGYICGLLLVLILGIFISKISNRISYTTLVIVSCVIFFIFWLQQLLEIIQILIGRNLIPRFPGMVRFVMTALNYKNCFSYAHAFVLTVMAIGLWLKTHFTSVTGMNPAERRKIKAEYNSIRRYCLGIIIGFSVLIITITYLRSLSNKEVVISPPKEVVAEEGMITIPLNEVNDGHLHRFGYKTQNGTIVRFLTIRKNKTAYGVGLDACDICGASGYYQRGDQVICKLCDVAINISTIGFPGGCNPVPLDFSISRGNMSINPKLLEAERKRFE